MLFCNFFTQLHGHLQIFAVFKFFLQRLELSQFVFHQEVDTVQRYTTVVTDDTTTAVSIWKTSQNARFTTSQNFWSVDVEYTGVVRFAVFRVDF
ncbi:Uncharacterised protein [Vibrio cholerae]|nr:Uncharacterised protein [Vibrio cholerae]